MMRAFLIAATAALLFVMGCASLQEGGADAKLVVQYSVLKVAGNDPAKAQRIAEIAADVQRYASGETFITVELLVEAVRNEIRWDQLDAADTLLLNALLGRLRDELTERLGPDVLPDDVRLAASTVAAWVQEAAALVQ